MQITETNFCDLTGLCKLNPTRYPFLLESVINNELNKYSILFACPGKTIKQKDSNNFLELLESELKNHSQSTLNTIPDSISQLQLPFLGGYFVYLAYEFATKLEKSLNFKYQTKQLLAQATYFPSAIIVDHTKNKTYIIDETNCKNTILIQSDINNISLHNKCDNNTKFQIKGSIKKDIYTDNDFIKSVDIAKKHIRAGDIFQANLSKQWQIQIDNNIQDIDIYTILKQKNPAPFACFAKFDDFSIISSSPERLFKIDNNIIETRPIAGTRPRGVGSKDKQLKSELRDNLKEQAEHLMLLDLERNDLGRVCKYGTVEVDEVMSIESYEFVHHIVSNIKGELKNNIKFSDILRAIFPGGTITGCPKIRSMQIINELEKTQRGAYTGSVGYISNCGKMDFNILIRTITLNNANNNQVVSFRAGAGIVFDSMAPNELKETRHKAQGMLKAFAL